MQHQQYTVQSNQTSSTIYSGFEIHGRQAPSFINSCPTHIAVQFSACFSHKLWSNTNLKNVHIAYTWQCMKYNS